MNAKVSFPQNWIIITVILFLLATYVFTMLSIRFSYQNSRFEGGAITPSKLTDGNWENGINRDGLSILFDYTVAREKFISDARVVICAGEKRKIRDYRSTPDGWLIVKISGDMLLSSSGYPNSCIFKK